MLAGESVIRPFKELSGKTKMIFLKKGGIGGMNTTMTIWGRSWSFRGGDIQKPRNHNGKQWSKYIAAQKLAFMFAKASVPRKGRFVCSVNSCGDQDASFHFQSSAGLQFLTSSPTWPRLAGNHLHLLHKDQPWRPKHKMLITVREGSERPSHRNVR